MRTIQGYKLLVILGVLVLFTLSSGVALAWLIGRGYAGPYPNQYTVESGTLYGDYDPNYPPGVSSYGGYASFHWSPNATNWINANINTVFSLKISGLFQIASITCPKRLFYRPKQELHIRRVS